MNKKVEDYAPEYPELITGFADFGHIKLERVNNCRDLGGLPCADGRRIKHGRLIRSAELHHATEQDMEILTKEHGLARVIDLRTAAELEREEDPIAEMAGIEYLNIRPIPNEKDLTGGEKGDLATLKRAYEDTPGIFLDIYREMVTTENGIDVFSRLMDIVLNAEDGATLWHCTQGKDRTGLSAVFIERALGASEDVIRADYLATNLFAKPPHEKLDAVIRDIPVVSDIEVDVEARTYAQMCNLECAFGEIEKEFGSLDAFIVEALDFGADKQAKLREMYLE